MAENSYNVEEVDIPELESLKKFNDKDTGLLESFTINRTFDSSSDIVELHIYTSGNSLLRSVSNLLSYRFEGGEITGEQGTPTLTLNPSEDALSFGYPNGGVKLTYLFINNLFSDGKLGPKLYITDINNDRTELKLSSTGISNEDLQKYANSVREKLDSTSYFSEFRLNLGNNNFIIGLNIDYFEESVIVKLYEPLPLEYDIKSTLDIVEFIAEPKAYDIESEFTPTDPTVRRLKEANFNIELEDNTSTPSQFFNFDELFSYNVENSNYQVLSLFNEKSAEISIDHTNFEDFIHFSSAEERIVNFKYKLDLINNYSSSISSINSTLGSSGITSNVSYYENLIEGIVNNFDHYERFLYFESGSYAWPKINDVKPYINQPSSTNEAITFFSSIRASGSNFDTSNFNALTNTIPSFIRDDANNEAYTLFVHMLGQHFDNLWIYSKALSDKYNADNRINKGISRDLVEEAIKSLGVKLYNSSDSLKDLFKYFIGEQVSEEGEVINTEVIAGRVVSGSTTYLGSNNGVEATFTGLERAFYYGTIDFPFGPLANDDFSMRFDYNEPSVLNYSSQDWGSYDRGQDCFVTITSASVNIVDEARYTKLSHLDYAFNLPYYGASSGQFLVREYTLDNPYQKARFNLHPIDADGVDHSAAFLLLHSSQTPNPNFDVTVTIKDSKSTTAQPEVKPYERVSQDIYQKSIYKRIYHNLPLLLKTKGTQRGLRALINCFGIPANVLKIRTFGGKRTDLTPFFGNQDDYILSENKVRTNFSSSIVDGNILSQYTSTLANEDYTYSNDLHNIEVGFSPSNDINEVLKSNLSSSFSLDDYIGNPGDLTSDSYTNLEKITKEALSTVTEKFDIKDFIRLIKFFDNVIFKMIKDFVPARSTVDTGVIIKPHLLDRSKIKSVSGSATHDILNTGSIDTAFASGSHADAFAISTGESSTNYRVIIQTPLGRRLRAWLPDGSGLTNINNVQYLRSHEESKFDGELARSRIRLSNGELNAKNPFKNFKYPLIKYRARIFKEVPQDFCILDQVVFDDDDFFIIQEDTTSTAGTSVDLALMFNNTVSGNTKFYKNYSLQSTTDGGLNANITGATEIDADGDFTYIEDGLGQYEEVSILALDSVAQPGVGVDCASERSVKRVDCSISANNSTGILSNTQPINIFGLGFIIDTDINSDFSFFKQFNGGNLIEITNPDAHIIGGTPGQTVNITLRDNQDPTGCIVAKSFTITDCDVGLNQNFSSAESLTNGPTFTDVAGNTYQYNPNGPNPSGVSGAQDAKIVVPLYFTNVESGLELGDESGYSFFIQIRGVAAGNLGNNDTSYSGNYANAPLNLINAENVAPGIVLDQLDGSSAADDLWAKIPDRYINPEHGQYDGGLPTTQLPLKDIFFTPDTNFQQGFKAIHLRARKNDSVGCNQLLTVPLTYVTEYSTSAGAINLVSDGVSGNSSQFLCVGPTCQLDLTSQNSNGLLFRTYYYTKFLDAANVEGLVYNNLDDLIQANAKIYNSEEGAITQDSNDYATDGKYSDTVLATFNDGTAETDVQMTTTGAEYQPTFSTVWQNNQEILCTVQCGGNFSDDEDVVDNDDGINNVDNQF